MGKVAPVIWCKCWVVVLVDTCNSIVARAEIVQEVAGRPRYLLNQLMERGHKMMNVILLNGIIILSPIPPQRGYSPSSLMVTFKSRANGGELGRPAR